MASKIYEDRRYQTRTVEQFVDWSKQLDQRLATIILPTGTGKTYCAAKCISMLPKGAKILWAHHRKELSEQAEKTFQDVLGDRTISVEMAERRADPSADIIVGSVATLRRDRKNLQGFVPDYIFIDEYHHFDEDNVSYQGLLDRFPDKKVVGLTATPYRFGGGDLPLGRKLINMDVGIAVAKGYLVPPKPRVIVSNVSLANVHTKKGDFDIKELSDAVNVKARNELIAKNVLELVREGRKGILFGVDVEHSKAMADILRPHCRVGEVYGETPDEERIVLMAKMRAGEIDVLCNNLVCTEGFDVPHISFIAVARPTRSLGLYIQMVGRGLRKYPDKLDCVILDVFDKIKTQQSRITFMDMAAAGDLYGDSRRALEILKAKLDTEKIDDNGNIAEKLIHFPVFLKKAKTDRWTIDSSSWFALSWVIADNQWLVTWSKEVVLPKPSKEIEVWDNMFGPPHYTDLTGDDFIVKHETLGKGIARGVKKEDNVTLLNVDFGTETKWIPFSELKKREITQQLEDVPDDIIRVSRCFYICMPEESNEGRVIHFIKKGNGLFVKHDIKDTRENIDAFIRGQAEIDEAAPIVKAGARWRQNPATDKQKNFIKKLMSWGKIGLDLDMESVTKGDAGSLIDMATWQDVINKYFATSRRENLVGHNAMNDDI